MSLNWIDGKNLGITRHRIRVEAIFSCKKPLSFTTRIEFIDDTDRVYPIHISGTTDNCLFTCFPFIQRSIKGEFSIKLAETKDEVDKISIGNILIEAEEDDVNSVECKTPTSRSPSIAINKKKGISSTLSYSSSKSSLSLLGYQPIPVTALDSSVEYVARWLNYYVL